MEGDVLTKTEKSESMRISIHALRMEGDRIQSRRRHPPAISIHALRMEGDFVRISSRLPVHLISIHALRMEGD